MLPKLELDKLCHDILNEDRTKLHDRSFSDLIHDNTIDFAGYVGYTELKDVAKEAFAFASNRGGNRPLKQDGTQPRSTHVLAKVAQPGEKTHYTAKECREVLGMDYLVVYESSVKLNAFAVEAALQRALQHIPLGRRLWRCVAMGQKKQDTLPGAALYKVFFTYSFKCRPPSRTRPSSCRSRQLSTPAPCARPWRSNIRCPSTPPSAK
jgi:hypothetical protein